MIRRQIPVYSPLEPTLLARAALDALLGGERARRNFERYLSERFRANRVILTGSGTQALQLAMRYAAQGEAGPVALPAYACYDLVSAAVGAERTIIFYDVDPKSLTPDEVTVERALRQGARTMVAASLFGFPLDWSRTKEVCRREGVTLIEDSAQGLGSEWAGAEGGTFGDMTVLSFGRGKGWTGGGGGSLMLRGEIAAGDAHHTPLEATRALAGPKALSLSVAQWFLGRPGLYALPSSVPGVGLGETRYHEPVAPTRISAFEAASALRHAAAANLARSVRAERALDWDALWGEVEPPANMARCVPLPDGVCSYLRYPVVASDGARAREVQERGLSRGVAGGYPLALPDLPQAQGLIRCPSPTPGASLLAEALVTFPTHRFVTSGDVQRLASAL